ncbi:MAG: hypothetical protein Q7T11_07830 [Deltaproteobacteria bacterium]|nr:hypothetical protein [Deltaproteobacteria bacterium]
MAIHIDGRITGLELEALKASLLLSIHVASSAYPDQDLLLAYQEIMKPRTRDGIVHDAFFDDSLVDKVAQNMRGVHRRMTQNPSLKKEWERRLEIFDQIVRDFEKAAKDGHGISIRSSSHIEPKKDDPALAALFAQYGPVDFSLRVADFRHQKKSNILVYLILDNGHLSPIVQRAIREQLLKIPNLQMHGVEGRTGPLDFRIVAQGPDPVMRAVALSGNQASFDTRPCLESGAKAYIDRFDEGGSLVFSGLALECLLGDSLHTLGVEDSSFKEKGRSFKKRKQELNTSPDILAKATLFFEEYEHFIERGFNAIRTLVSEARGEFTTVAITFGHGHYDELREQLIKEGVSFVILEPIVDKR